MVGRQSQLETELRLVSHESPDLYNSSRVYATSRGTRLQLVQYVHTNVVFRKSLDLMLEKKKNDVQSFLPTYL